MASIFDGITVPGAGITPGTSTGRATVPTVVAAPAASAQTGLVATVEPAEFVKLVGQAGDHIVLHVKSTQTTTAPGGRPGAARTVHRYTLGWSGVVFITQSGGTIDLPPGTRLVECSGILYEGKPIA